MKLAKNADVRLDDDDRAAVASLASVTFVVGSHDKRFANTLLAYRDQREVYVTHLQWRYLWRLVWRYRRQIPTENPSVNQARKIVQCLYLKDNPLAGVAGVKT